MSNPDHVSTRLRPSGGYRRLRTFQTATIIYDATVSFCRRFVDSRSRTNDQMIQAARSGRQNIAEGSRASAVSSQTELRLVNVARASLDELLLDFEDFLRQNGLPQWTKNDPQARSVRNAGRAGGNPYGREPYAAWLSGDDPAVVANAMICLIHQANYLLDRQISSLERRFIEDGGYTERLAAERIKQRRERPGSSRPVCPECGEPMALRTARKGRKAGGQFWGCSCYPHCRGMRRLDGKTKA